MSDIGNLDPNAELNALFPNLAGIVSNWQAGSSTTDPLANAAEHAGVTDEQVAAFFANRLNGRAPLAPVVQGQQVPGAPQFQAGVGAPPPPASHVEGDAGAAGVGSGANSGANGVDTGIPGALPAGPSSQDAPGAPEIPAPAGSEQAPVAPVSAPQGGENSPNPPFLPPQPEIPPFVQVGDRTIPTEKINQWEAFEKLLADDPTLRNAVGAYLTTGQLPAGFQGQPQPAPQPPFAPANFAPVAPQQGSGVVQPPTPDPAAIFAPLTPPPNLDMDDPAVAALWSQMENQHNLLGQLAVQQQQIAAQTMQTRQQDTVGIVNTALTQFKTTYDLDDAQLQEIRQVAARLNVVDSFMQGFDPITGAPVAPDPIMAVQRSLELAYKSLPQFAAREFEREQRQRIEADTRKRKAGSLSGTSGSAPRTAPAPTTPQAASAALHDEVAAMFAGKWNQPE